MKCDRCHHNSENVEPRYFRGELLGMLCNWSAYENGKELARRDFKRFIDELTLKYPQEKDNDGRPLRNLGN